MNKILYKVQGLFYLLIPEIILTLTKGQPPEMKNQLSADMLKVYSFFSSVQFSNSYISPIHNNSPLKVLYIVK